MLFVPVVQGKNSSGAAGRRIKSSCNIKRLRKGDTRDESLVSPFFYAECSAVEIFRGHEIVFHMLELIDAGHDNC